MVEINDKSNESENDQINTGVVAIIIKNNQYLLVKQNKEPFKNAWGPVHGTVQPGETELEAVVRETQEEIGLLVKPLKRLWVSHADYGVEKLYWWLVEPQDGNIKIDIKEISEYGYFSLDQLFNLTLFPMAKKFFSELMK